MAYESRRKVRGIIDKQIKEGDLKGRIIEDKKNEIILKVSKFQSHIIVKHTKWYVSYISHQDNETFVILRK